MQRLSSMWALSGEAFVYFNRTHLVLYPCWILELSLNIQYTKIMIINSVTLGILLTHTQVTNNVGIRFVIITGGGGVCFFNTYCSTQHCKNILLPGSAICSFLMNEELVVHHCYTLSNYNWYTGNVHLLSFIHIMHSTYIWCVWIIKHLCFNITWSSNCGVLPLPKFELNKHTKVRAIHVTRI